MNYGVIAIKSLTWPGLNLIFYNKQWQFVYFGQGFKNNDDWYFPREPQLMQEEGEERSEYPEPNAPKVEK